MSNLARYWVLVKLDNAGRAKREVMVDAQHYIQQQFVDGEDLQIHLKIQRQLIQTINNQLNQNDLTTAALCLRCFISHQIEQICIQLETQFGHYYGFTRRDLFPFVLDDDGKPSHPAYQPLSVRILSRFDPHRASLSTWTARLVKQHHDLNAFLLERGLCLLSDWAILNDTTQKKLNRVLTQFHHLTEQEVHQASSLLDSYHAVYRRDRILKGQKGQCPEPAEQQLKAISDLIQEKNQQPCPPEVVLSRLHHLADRLRQHRISTRGGIPPAKSFDQPENASLLESLQTKSSDDQEESQIEFLQFYRQQFLTSLETALESIVGDRLQALKPPKDQSFLTGLQLFHCQGLSMSDIAAQIGLQAQYQVSRLLNLKAFRADIRHSMLNHLRQCVLEKALSYLTPEQLNHLDSQIETALSEQIDELMQADQASAKTPKSYVSGSLFAKSVCRYLDRLLTNAEQPTVSH